MMCRMPRLPAPTGPHVTGTTALHLSDPARPDPWVPGRDRELMVTLWYPAASPGGLPWAGYLSTTESELLLASGGITNVPADVLSTTRTNSVPDAPPAGSTGSLPLVVLSPGFTKPRATLTSLAEDLASHGYLVAAIDHTYENVATTFPGGRVTRCLARDMSPVRDESFWTKVVRGRAADVSFVLDELSRRPGAALLDPAKIAMAGHSVGGAAAIAAMLADERIRAAVNLDGTAHAVIPDGGLGRPVLLLGRQVQYRPGAGPAADSWARDWPLLTGSRRWLTVAGAKHPSFTDLGLLADQLGLASGAGTTGARAMAITRAHVRAFLDLHLRGVAEPVAAFPEVESWSPDGRPEAA